MPRPAKVLFEDAVQAVKDFAMHFTTNKFPSNTSEVWTDMSVRLEGKWTAHDVYTAVREHLRCILSTARAELGIIVVDIKCKDDNRTSKYIDDSNFIDEPEVNDRTSADDFNNNTCVAALMEFDLTLTQEQWDAIKPNGTVTYGRREKYVLTAGVWTNTISIALWKQEKLRCAFVFKRADVLKSQDESSFSLKIQGSCMSKICGNKIDIFGEKRLDENGLILRVKTQDTRGIFHETVKRPLNGERRCNVQNELKTKGCKNWQREQARLHMENGDIVPNFIQDEDVLKNAKKERNNADLGVVPEDGRDLISAIEEFSLTEAYCGLIHAVGARPFFVFYSSPAEMKAYQKYCRMKRSEATIILDSTGSLVKKLVRSNGQNSGHIFLYSIVVNFENTTLPVHQMLTETHTTEFIEYWLRLWMRAGAPKPNVTVTDYSRALILGLCFAFNNCTIKSYVETCFSIATNICQPVNKPETLIRIDVAHFTHMVCRWKSLKSVQHTCIKEFFVRCVSLMVDSQSISDFELIFSLTCAVGLQSHKDSEIDLHGVQTTKEARNMLETFIADRKIDVDFEAVEKKSDDDELNHNQPDGYGPCEFESCYSHEVTRPGTLLAWLKQRIDKAKLTVHVGKNLNPFYLPDFIGQLFNVAREFPLWSSATIPSVIPHASSSYVEGYFSDLKKRILKDNPPPIRVDKFIKIHIESIIGETLIFSSKMIVVDQRTHVLNQLPQKNLATTKDVNGKQNCTERGIFDDNQNVLPQDKIVLNINDSDLLAQEDWRGKASNGNIGYLSDNDLTEECTELSMVPVSTSSQICYCTEIHYDESSGESVSDRVSMEKFNTVNCAELSDYFSVVDPDYLKLNTSQDVMDSLEKPFNVSGSSNRIEFDLHTEPILEKNARPPTYPEILLSCVNEAPKSKMKNTKYYKPYPEIRQRNLLIEKTKKPFLLLNGGLCKFSMNVDGHEVFVRSTCAFDSLVHVIMTGALDDLEYAGILEQSSNKMMQFIWKLMNSGATRNIYRDRAVLLKLLGYACTPEIRTAQRILSYGMNAWDSTGNVVNKTLLTYPSVYVSAVCSGCDGQSYPMPYLAPNHRIIAKEGFGMLEKALDFRPCIKKICCQKCKGSATLDKKLNFHIIIDLDIRPTTGLDIATKGLECKLTQLPKTLSLRVEDEMKVIYRLIGVVTFSSNHFVAHCRRSTGNWQLYDDVAADIQTSKTKVLVEPHLAVYLRQKEQN